MGIILSYDLTPPFQGRLNFLIITDSEYKVVKQPILHTYNLMTVKRWKNLLYHERAPQ